MSLDQAHIIVVFIDGHRERFITEPGGWSIRRGLHPGTDDVLIVWHGEGGTPRTEVPTGNVRFIEVHGRVA